MGDPVIMKSGGKIVCLAGLAVLLSCCLAYGATWHKLAYSKSMDAEVFVDSNGDDWCKTTVVGKVNLGQKSPLLQGGVDGFLQKVVTVLQKDCPSVSGVRFDIYRDEGKTLVSSYSLRSDNNWIAQKVIEQRGKSLDEIPEVASPAAKPAHVAVESVNAEYLNLVHAVLAPAQEISLNDSTMVDYLKIIHCKDYHRVADNEIKLAKLEQHYMQEAQVFFDSATPKYLSVSFLVKLGQYDLNKGAFSFEPFKNMQSFSFERPLGLWGCRASSAVFPPKIVLNIRGGEFIKTLDVSPDKAEALIKTLPYRKALVLATVEVVGSTHYSDEINDASVDTILHSARVINERTEKMFYEFPNSWIGPKVAETQAAMAKAREERQKKIAEDLAKKEQERIALADRIERGVEPVEVDGAIAYAHYQKLSAPTDSHVVDGVDTRRPLLLVVESMNKDGFVQIGGSRFNTQPPTEIVSSLNAKGKPPIRLIIQNWKDFVRQQVPQGLLSQAASQDQLFFSGPSSYVTLTVKPVGYMNDPWKGGNGLVVYASSAEYAIKSRAGELKTWILQATTPPKDYVQRLDSRTARELDVAGLHGAMDVDDVRDTLEDKLNLATSFDENVKILKSPNKVFVSEFFNAGRPESSFASGEPYFEGYFVQTGKSLMGLGSPVYSLKQAVLGQTATAKEKDAIVEGLIKKFGEPDLQTGNSHTIVLTWGKRITDDRSHMPIGKEFRLPVSAVEAQIYHSEQGVFTVLILTDELYLKKTNVTTKTVY
jgi:hypothetical protein